MSTPGPEASPIFQTGQFYEGPAGGFRIVVGKLFVKPETALFSEKLV